MKLTRVEEEAVEWMSSYTAGRSHRLLTVFLENMLAMLSRALKAFICIGSRALRLGISPKLQSDTNIYVSGSILKHYF